jgi:hypothetical protein
MPNASALLSLRFPVASRVVAGAVYLRMGASGVDVVVAVWCWCWWGVVGWVGGRGLLQLGVVLG